MNRHNFLLNDWSSFKCDSKKEKERPIIILSPLSISFYLFAIVKLKGDFLRNHKRFSEATNSKKATRVS